MKEIMLSIVVALPFLVASSATVVVAPTAANAQIGANAKYSKQGWRNGVWCRNVQSARCQERAAKLGKGY